MGKIKLNGQSIYIKHINKIEFIGKGANGKVYKCYHELHDTVNALKIWVPKKGISSVNEKQFRAEIQKLITLNHPNIVEINYGDFFISNNTKIYYCIMEYVEGATLRSYLKNTNNISGNLAIAREIISALEYSHKKKIFHGDLHTENIIVNGTKVKILDFGTSIFNSDYSKLRASWLLSSTLSNLLPYKYKYLPLLNKTILDFISIKDWHTVRNKYKNKEYPEPEFILSSFKAILEVIKAEEILKNISGKEAILYDLASILMGSPFLVYEELERRLKEFISLKELNLFTRYMVETTHFGIEYERLFTNNIQNLFSKSQSDLSSPQAYYYSLQKAICDIDSYRVWKDFYDKVLMLRNVSSLWD